MGKRDGGETTESVKREGTSGRSEDKARREKKWKVLWRVGSVIEIVVLDSSPAGLPLIARSMFQAPSPGRVVSTGRVMSFTFLVLLQDWLRRCISGGLGPPPTRRLVACPRTDW
jgi:hypothetical protein